MRRILYTLSKFITFRGTIQEIYLSSNYTVNTALDVDIERLKKIGIKVLVLDFDGVLAPHGQPIPVEEVLRWLQNLLKVFPGKIMVLTNKPTIERENYFRQYFPQIKFIIGVRKKPYPDALQKISLQYSVKPEEIALLDDRLLTGVLAAVINGSKALYVKKPYIDTSSFSVIEYWFRFLRAMEKILIK